MNTENLSTIASQLLETQTCPTAQTLLSLANKPEWDAQDNATIAALARRLDINGRLHHAYYEDGKIADKTPVETPVLEAFAALILRQIFNTNDTNIQLKLFNVLFKLLDKSTPEWHAEYKETIAANWAECLQKFPIKTPTPIISAQTYPKPTEKKEIGITVLFHEGPVARAYLEIMRSCGLYPERIIHIVQKNDIISHKPVASWLPQSIRSAYQANVQLRKIHHWPKYMARKYKAHTKCIKQMLEDTWQIPGAVFKNATDLLPLKTYCDNIETISIDNLKDPNLENALKSDTPSLVLFTGGGMMPASLLELANVKFLHVHPGYLPDIRGAECMLWSALLTGNTSATLFYMSAGIDIGNVIHPLYLPKLTMPNANDLSPTNRYRFLFSFVDPWIRAYTLRDTLLKTQNFKNMSDTPQKEADGTMYHYMHPILHEASTKLFWQS